MSRAHAPVKKSKFVSKGDHHLWSRFCVSVVTCVALTGPCVLVAVFCRATVDGTGARSKRMLHWNQAPRSFFLQHHAVSCSTMQFRKFVPAVAWHMKFCCA